MIARLAGNGSSIAPVVANMSRPENKVGVTAVKANTAMAVDPLITAKMVMLTHTTVMNTDTITTITQIMIMVMTMGSITHTIEIALTRNMVDTIILTRTMITLHTMTAAQSTMVTLSMANAPNSPRILFDHHTMLIHQKGAGLHTILIHLVTEHVHRTTNRNVSHQSLAVLNRADLSDNHALKGRTLSHQKRIADRTALAVESPRTVVRSPASVPFLPRNLSAPCREEASARPVHKAEPLLWSRNQMKEYE